MIAANAQVLLEKLPCTTKTISLGEDVEVRLSEIDANTFLEIWENERFRAAGDPDKISLSALAPYLVVESVVNEEGEKILTVDDYKRLSRGAQFRLNLEALKINGLMETDDKEEGGGTKKKSGVNSSSDSV